MLPLDTERTRMRATRTYPSASSRSPVVRRPFPGAGQAASPWSGWGPGDTDACARPGYP